jgi:hypothetical protein
MIVINININNIKMGLKINMMGEFAVGFIWPRRKISGQLL